MAAQADEVDERYLHFENDLYTTASFINAVFSLSEMENKPVAISSVCLMSFTDANLT